MKRMFALGHWLIHEITLVFILRYAEINTHKTGGCTL